MVSPSWTETMGPGKSAALTGKIQRDIERREHERTSDRNREVFPSKQKSVDQQDVPITGVGRNYSILTVPAMLVALPVAAFVIRTE